MRRPWEFLRAKLARRIVLLFVACALVPVAIFSLLSFRHVARELSDQSRERLRDLSKETGVGVLQRLHLLDAELERVVSGLRGTRVRGTETAGGSSDGGQSFGDLSPSATRPDWPARWFLEPDAAVAIRPEKGVEDRIAARAQEGFVDGIPAGAADSTRLARLRSGEPLIRTVGREGRPAVRIGRAVEPGVPERGVLWVEVEPEFLLQGPTSHGPRPWQAVLPAGVSLCIVGDGLAWPDCPPALREALSGLDEDSSHTGHVQWRVDGEDHLAAYWSLFLRPDFGSPAWRFVLSEPASRVLAPVIGLRRTLLLSVLLALLVVLFLAQVQVRRNLEPLRKLQEGTRRIGERDFGSRVEIYSGDEFAELATAFNSMAERLGRQFDALVTASEIDRAILGALDPDTIVQTVLRRGPGALAADRVALTLLDPAESGDRGSGRTGWTFATDGGDTLLRRRAHLNGATARRLARSPEGVVLPGGEEGPIVACPPELDRAASGAAAPRWFVLPLVVDEKMAGTIACTVEAEGPDELRDHARQLADHVSVALSNAHLVEELDRLNVEIVAAFARAVDAKSAWTAGHSERVTARALALGRELGLPEAELELLERGGLLHDIGKIGVPGAVLDKPGPLTEDERRMVEAHTVIGARIVEAISRFGRLVPIVRHHHERVDGSGYPDGLAGEEIDLLARIVAVADVFDALTSDRPYRAASPHAEALAFLEKRSGSMLEPVLVEAFLRVMRNGDPAKTEDAKTGDASSDAPSIDEAVDETALAGGRR